MKNSSLTLKKIFYFWLPLALTWIMMSIEGPFLAMVIARLADPKHNLAAYGFAIAIAMLIEAPIIMIMSVSTAIVEDRDSFLKLRNFTYGLNAIITACMIFLLIPSVFDFIANNLLRLPEGVDRLAYKACLLLIPWPAAIGYRRFFQGILIRRNLTRRVTYGTIVRLLSMGLTGLICYGFFEIDGASVGALALSIGVCAEAAASKFMARSTVIQLLSEENRNSKITPWRYRSITRFYYPLAMTSILTLGIYPIVTFFLGHSFMALESLAVFPVVNSLVFIFRSLGLSFQEVGIALLGANNEGYDALKKFAILLGFAVTAGLAFLAFTPLSDLWFRDISGLSLELTEFAGLPTKIMAPMPGLMVLLSLQRSLLVLHRKTGQITLGTTIEVAGIIALLVITVDFLGLVGALAAAISLLLGRTLANAYLFLPFSKVLKVPHK